MYKMMLHVFICMDFITLNAFSSDLFFFGYRKSFKALRLNQSNFNLIISSPHAGSRLPDYIPDRSIGGCRRMNSTAICTFNYTDSCSDGTRCPTTTVQDFADFDPFAERLFEEFDRTYHLRPYVIIAGWNRKKIDFNREINEATFQHPQAMKAHRAYHRYLNKAIQHINEHQNGRQGLLLDVHQHAQGNYTMVGILLSGTQLNQEEFSSTSIESLIRWSCPDDRRNCITGNKSLGTFFEINGLGIAYPSLDHPRPANRTFYRGGYITSHYAARINVIQTELSYVVRNEFDYSDYIQRYVRALLNFMKVNRLMDDSCQP